MIFVRLLLIVVCAHLSTSALALQSSERWLEIGTVQEWMDLDAAFYRSPEKRAWGSEQKIIADQPVIYRGTFRYSAPLPAIVLTAWLDLDPEDQQRRSAQAADELKIVVRFLNRMRGWTRDFQATGSSGWGRQNSVDILPDCLESLTNAVQLEPANPLAWHLLGYFSTCVGDVKRARGAFAGAEDALALLPAEALPEVRRRLALEAERALGDLGTAQYYLIELTGGNDEIPGDTQVWALVGFICLDQGDLVGGRLALEKASALDPDNYGLKQQLARLEHKEGM